MNMMKWIYEGYFAKPLSDLIFLIYPDLCQVCSTALTYGEEFVCIKCMHHLPQTMFENMGINPVEKKFWGKAQVEKATAIFYYKKGNSVQILLHKLKYGRKKKLGENLGRIFAHKLRDMNFFGGIDLIIPVPLHKTRLKKRGFNQCVIFAKELSSLSGIEYSDRILLRIRSNVSQTKKGRFERWQNTSELFAVENENKVQNKSILLIDDVITTGSTLEACIKAILNKSNAKIYIATFAYSD